MAKCGKMSLALAACCSPGAAAVTMESEPWSEMRLIKLSYQKQSRSTRCVAHVYTNAIRMAARRYATTAGGDGLIVELWLQSYHQAPVTATAEKPPATL